MEVDSTRKRTWAAEDSAVEGHHMEWESATPFFSAEEREEIERKRLFFEDPDEVGTMWSECRSEVSDFSSCLASSCATGSSSGCSDMASVMEMEERERWDLLGDKFNLEHIPVSRNSGMTFQAVQSLNAPRSVLRQNAVDRMRTSASFALPEGEEDMELPPCPPLFEEESPTGGQRQPRALSVSFVVPEEDTSRRSAFAMDADQGMADTATPGVERQRTPFGSVGVGMSRGGSRVDGEGGIMSYEQATRKKASRRPNQRRGRVRLWTQRKKSKRRKNWLFSREEILHAGLTDEMEPLDIGQEWLQ